MYACVFFFLFTRGLVGVLDSFFEKGQIPVMRIILMLYKNQVKKKVPIEISMNLAQVFPATNIQSRCS